MLKNKAINKIEEGLKNSSSTTHGLERMSHTRLGLEVEPMCLDENKKGTANDSLSAQEMASHAFHKIFSH